MKRFSFKLLAVTLLVAVAAYSCIDDKFDTPPIVELPEGSVLTIQKLKELCPPGNTYKINGDSSLYAVVTMDEMSGNIYRNIFVQDNSGAANLRFGSTSGLYEGDSIRLYLKGAVLSWYNNLFQIDSLHADYNVVKQATERFVEPEVATISQINLDKDYFQSRLVKIEDVQIRASDTASIWAPYQQYGEIYIEDTEGNEMMIRTSGYAKFAGENVPNGYGSIIAIVGLYRETVQLGIRRTSEVKLDGERFSDDGGSGIDPEPATVIEEDFESFTTGFGDVYFSKQVDSKGWKGFTVLGQLQPDLRSFNDNNFVQFSAHRSSGVSSGDIQEFWAISPRIDVSGASYKKLSFQTAAGYFNANTLFDVYVLDGDNPTTANKTKLDGWKKPTASDLSGSYTPFIPSGEIDLSSFSGVIRIGFYYKGTSGSGNSTTYQIDNFSFGVAEAASLTVSPSSLSFIKEGESKTFTVTSNSTWSAVSSDPTNFSISINGDEVTVTTIENNTDEGRSAIITVTTTDNSATKTVTCNQSGPAAPVGSNMLTNASFEDFAGDVPAGWNQGVSPNNAPFEKISTGAQDGSIAIKIAGNSDGRCDLKQPISGIEPGKTYIVSFWYKDNSKTAGSSGIRLWSNFTNGGQFVAPADDIKDKLQPVATFETVTEWTQYSVEVTAPVGVDGFNFEIRATKNNWGTIDNCSFVEKQ
jgi:hypothetical protein